jgi:PEP-CTERM motif
MRLLDSAVLKFRVAAWSVGVFLLLGETGFAAEMLDQQNDIVSGFGDTVSAFSQELGQTFTVGIAGQLTRIEIYMAKISASDSAVVTLFDTSGGLPSTALGTALVDSAAMSGTNYVSFDFSSYDLDVDVGDVLAFGMSSTAGGLYVWTYDPMNHYAAGDAIRRTVTMPPSAWAFEVGKDRKFKTYVDAAAGLAGDYNGNGVIDAADYTAWRDTVTANGTSLLNDPTPGSVDESDFVYWRNHFGAGGGGGAGAAVSAAAVPEPAAIVLAAMGTAGAGQLVRRRRAEAP